MPNVLLTTYCNRKCPYCFAVDAMDGAPFQRMSMTELITITDILVASRTMRVGVLGGEPMLHPQFLEMVWYLLLRGLRVDVFTNGICSADLVNQLDQLPISAKIKFVVNMNAPEIETEQNRARQERFVTRFADNCDLSLNIFHPDLDPSFLSDFAHRIGLRKRQIRVGIAQPIVGRQNEFLHLDHYRKVSGSIVALAESVFQLGITVGLDCGFAMCAFSDEQLGRLRRTNARTKFICKVPIDIAPGLQAWSCFPLNKRNRLTIQRTTLLGNLECQLLQGNDEIRKRTRKGIFGECEDCMYLQRNACDGGCLAHAIRTRDAAPTGAFGVEGRAAPLGPRPPETEGRPESSNNA